MIDYQPVFTFDNAFKFGGGCHNRPHVWPAVILSE